MGIIIIILSSSKDKTILQDDSADFRKSTEVFALFFEVQCLRWTTISVKGIFSIMQLCILYLRTECDVVFINYLGRTLKQYYEIAIRTFIAIYGSNIFTRSRRFILQKKKKICAWRIFEYYSSIYNIYAHVYTAVKLYSYLNVRYLHDYTF